MLLFSSDTLEIKSDFIKEIIFQINTVFFCSSKNPEKSENIKQNTLFSIDWFLNIDKCLLSST